MQYITHKLIHGARRGASSTIEFQYASFSYCLVSDPAIPMSLRKWNRSVKKFCIEDIGMSGEF